MTFQKDKYQVLENAISYELANFCFNYFYLKEMLLNICMTITS
jgi:hypothetical protein